MVNCPHCGAENGERNLRCSLCGKPLAQGSMPQAGTGSVPPRPGSPQPQSDPLSYRQQPSPDGTPNYNIYGDAPASGARGTYQAPPPGARSMSERITYRDVKEKGGVKLGLNFTFNRRALVSAVLILILGTLFIVATYASWLKLEGFGAEEYSGWGLYELGKSGERSGSSFHISGIFDLKSESDFDTSSGIILTGVWTLTGGILLVAMALLLPFLNRSYLCIIVMVVGLVMLVASGFNLATVLIAKGQPYWPIYVLPPAGLAAIVVGYDARHHF